MRHLLLPSPLQIRSVDRSSHDRASDFIGFEKTAMPKDFIYLHPFSNEQDIHSQFKCPNAENKWVRIKFASVK